MRVVIDTSVWVRFLVRPSAALRRLVSELWLENRLTLVVAPELLDELALVLQRPKLSRYLSGAEGRVLLDAIRQHCIALASLGPVPPFTRDPKDDKFVACAINGAADYLITYDEDLLVLRRVGDLLIVTPETLVSAWSD